MPIDVKSGPGLVLARLAKTLYDPARLDRLDDYVMNLMKEREKDARDEGVKTRVRAEIDGPIEHKIIPGHAAEVDHEPHDKRRAQAATAPQVVPSRLADRKSVV